MPSAQEYFPQLADAATAFMRGEFPGRDPESLVSDAAQQTRAAAWQAVAVHPMQVLETAYQDIVRAAGEHAAGDDARMEREFDALSRFFTLTSAPPVLLGTPDGQDGVRPVTLIDDDLDGLSGGIGLARDLIGNPRDGRTAYGVLGDVVGHATRLLERMAPAGVAGPLPDGVRKAADYAGMYGTGLSAADAAAGWVNAHQNVQRDDDLKGLADQVEEGLVRPLQDGSNTLSAVRALYNIPAFYLLRLMHRFHGGSAGAVMPVEMRRKASGNVTGNMHPAWMQDWSEHQVAALSDALGQADRDLRAHTGRQDPLLRFYLKGGRALYTALGRPGQGSNDWDTGILIDPDLTPDQWYEAFERVNNLLLDRLDQARFDYTQYVYAHIPAQALHADAAARLSEPDPGNTAMSDIADAAEQQVLRAAHPTQAVAALPGMLSAAGGDTGLAGVNGELIDIGIPTRSSVELRELWHGLTVDPKPGTSGLPLPVPDMAYYVTDLSTILREAVGSDQTGLKLSKRLERLCLALASDRFHPDTDRLTQALPKTVNTLAPDLAGPAGRAQAAALTGLVDSLADTPDRYPGLDDYLQQQASTGQLYALNDPVVARIWADVQAAVPADQQDAAHGVLAVQAGSHRVAGAVLQDLAARARWLGATGPGMPSNRTMQGILTALTVHSSGGPALVLAGALAARQQLTHAGAGNQPDTWPVDIIEMELWAGDAGQADTTLAGLRQRLSQPQLGAQTDITGTGAQARLHVRIPTPGGAVMGGGSQVALVIRPVVGKDPARLDEINGWRVLPARELVEHYLAKAAATPDHDIRQLAHHTTDTLLQRVLGHPIGAPTSQAF